MDEAKDTEPSSEALEPIEQRNQARALTRASTSAERLRGAGPVKRSGAPHSCYLPDFGDSDGGFRVSLSPFPLLWTLKYLISEKNFGEIDLAIDKTTWKHRSSPVPSTFWLG